MSSCPIPGHLRHRPTLGGLAVPYSTAQRPEDGMFLFGLIETVRQHECLTDRLCQICGDRLGEKFLILATESEIGLLVDFEDFSVSTRAAVAEPAIHHQCLPYTRATCPMLAGRMTHYRSSPPNIGDRATALTADTGGLGRPAEPWYVIEAADYEIISRPVGDKQLMTAVVTVPGFAAVPLADFGAEGR